MADILHVIDVHASPSVLFDTLTSVEGIRRWWSTTVEGSDEVDGDVTIRFGENWKVVMQRMESVPNERVVFRITEHDSGEWPGLN